MLELGGAFSAGLAVDGRSHRRRARRLGRPDRSARLRCDGRRGGVPLGAALTKRTVFSGGALETPGGDGWLALEEGGGEGRAGADDQRAGATRDPAHGAHAPQLLDGLGARLAHVAPVRLTAASAGRRARRGGPRRRSWPAGRHAALVERLGVRDASGSARSTTSGSTAPSRSGCAERFAQRGAPVPSRRSSPNR
jgi:hypothetical protein